GDGRDLARPAARPREQLRGSGAPRVRAEPSPDPDRRAHGPGVAASRALLVLPGGGDPGGLAPRRRRPAVADTRLATPARPGRRTPPSAAGLGGARRALLQSEQREAQPLHLSRGAGAGPRGCPDRPRLRSPSRRNSWPPPPPPT